MTRYLHQAIHPYSQSSICPSIQPSIYYPFIHPYSICPFSHHPSPIYPPILPFLPPSFHSAFNLFIHPFIHPSALHSSTLPPIYLSIIPFPSSFPPSLHSPMHLSVHQLIDLSIYPSIHPFSYFLNTECLLHTGIEYLKVRLGFL